MKFTQEQVEHITQLCGSSYANGIRDTVQAIQHITNDILSNIEASKSRLMSQIRASLQENVDKSEVPELKAVGDEQDGA